MADLQAPSGFCFENVSRNTRLVDMWNNDAKMQAAALGSRAAASTKPVIVPLAKKTGTTIAGCVFKGGVILGADTRATNGDEVADKNCEKIHYIADNMYCCGAGTAADTDQTTALISSQLELLRMNLRTSQVRVAAAETKLRRMLFRYQGHVSAALILGGVDKVDGPSIWSIYPHGSSQRFPYTSMGSGSLAAIAFLELGWKPDMEEADAIKLVQRAILGGIFNDLGSGSNCDIRVLRTDGTTEYQRPSLQPNLVEPYRNAVTRSSRLDIKLGATATLGSYFTPSKPAATLADVIVTEMEE